jgi:hypothetical protein
VSDLLGRLENFCLIVRLRCLCPAANIRCHRFDSIRVPQLLLNSKEELTFDNVAAQRAALIAQNVSSIALARATIRPAVADRVAAHA